MLNFALRWGAWSLCLALSGPAWAQSAASHSAADAVIVDMASAFKRGDAKKLSQLLPQARGHILEPWAAYWELRVRLDQASETEVRQFLSRYAHSYQEDRLRNDWLLLLGSRRDWTTMADEHVHYRMRDDREVQDRKSTRLNSSHSQQSRMPSSA